MKFFTSLFLFVTLTSALGQEAYPVYKGDVLFDGYDPVAYFDGIPRKGTEQYATLHDGRKVLFASDRNREKFEREPEKYAPAYGGWCAIAMVDETFVIPDYSLFKIQDGELLFFSIRAFFNGLTEWDKEPVENKIKADINYSVLFPGE